MAAKEESWVLRDRPQTWRLCTMSSSKELSGSKTQKRRSTPSWWRTANRTIFTKMVSEASNRESTKNSKRGYMLHSSSNPCIADTWASKLAQITSSLLRISRGPSQELVWVATRLEETKPDLRPHLIVRNLTLIIPEPNPGHSLLMIAEPATSTTSPTQEPPTAQEPATPISTVVAAEIASSEPEITTLGPNKKRDWTQVKILISSHIWYSSSIRSTKTLSEISWAETQISIWSTFFKASEWSTPEPTISAFPSCSISREIIWWSETRVRMMT